MNRPPLFMKFRIRGQNARFGCWLPLFLLAPIILVLLLLALPFVLIAAIVLWPFGWARKALTALPYLLSVIHALHGLKVEIDNGNDRINITVV